MKLTQSTKPVRAKDIKRGWHLIDAQGKVLGRMATNISRLLMGKNKTNYVSNFDMGDNVVVINALSVDVTGRKRENKIYSSYSGYPGGLKQVTFKSLQKRKPDEIIRHAVMGMLPKNKLRDRMITRLFIYADDKHPYQDKFETQKLEVKSTNKK